LYVERGYVWNCKYLQVLRIKLGISTQSKHSLLDESFVIVRIDTKLGSFYNCSGQTMLKNPQGYEIWVRGVVSKKLSCWAGGELSMV